MTRRRSSPPVAAPPGETAFRALIACFGLIRRVMAPHFASFGLSGSQWGVLRVLWRAEGEGVRALRLTDLGERLLVRPPSVTGVVARLEQRGLVARTGAARDGREKPARLTANGRATVRRVLRVHGRRIEDAMSGLDVAEQRRLAALLGKMQSRLRALTEFGVVAVDGPGAGRATVPSRSGSKRRVS